MTSLVFIIHRAVIDAIKLLSENKRSIDLEKDPIIVRKNNASDGIQIISVNIHNDEKSEIHVLVKVAPSRIDIELIDKISSEITVRMLEMKKNKKQSEKKPVDKDQYNVKDINEAIYILRMLNDVDANLISDGYHTFGELYDHRAALYIALCKCIMEMNNLPQIFYNKPVWKSQFHNDGTEIPGWFLLGINKVYDHQITYHLPICLWKDCDFAQTLEKAPEFDGHTSADVLQRLKKL